jgi:hypothetical protein
MSKHLLAAVLLLAYAPVASAQGANAGLPAGTTQEAKDWLEQKVQDKYKPGDGFAIGIVVVRPTAVTRPYIEEVKSVQVSPPDARALPAINVGDAKDYLNCSDSDQEDRISLKLSYKEGHVTKVTNGWSFESSSGESFRFGAKIGAKDVGLEGSESREERVTVRDTRQTEISEDTTQTIDLSYEKKFVFAKRTITAVSVSRSLYRYDIPFTATLLLNGSLTPEFARLFRPQKSKASDLLSSDERTVALNGYVSVSFISKETTSLKPRLVTDDECTAKRSSISMVSLRLSRKTLLAELAEGDVCYVAPCDLPLNGTREVCRYVAESGCTNCGSQSDSVCEPEPENDQKTLASFAVKRVLARLPVGPPLVAKRVIVTRRE